MNHLILYCRAGFEPECAQEIQDKASELEIYGFAKAERDSAYVVFQTYEEDGADRLIRELDFQEMTFARQWLAAGELIRDLPSDDRVTPLLEAAEAMGTTFGYLEVEAADTNEAKELLTFCRKFTSPLSRHLRKTGLLVENMLQPTLHAFFLDSSQCYLGYAPADNSSPWFMGIPRLKFPKSAPSRSTLKLEEAWLHFLSEEQQEEMLQPGMKAVDLGAAPGGWTWQFVKRSIKVYAVDNGPMDNELMDSGLVEHVQEDGFKYWPAKKVDWLVCDMVEKPIRIAPVMANWILKRRARYAVFNLKLPMKKRYVELQRCMDAIHEVMEDRPYHLHIKQLYHDREEVTCFLYRTDNKGWD